MVILRTLCIRWFRLGKSLQRLFSVGLVLFAIAAAAGTPDLVGEAKESLQINSSAFVHGGAIPKQYTCDGADISPPLSWLGLPAGTKSLVLIVDDPDAPDPAAPKRTWVHWVLFNLPPATSGLAAAVSALPTGTGRGLNDWKRTGYRGPCPPIGRHRYFHKLYALDTELTLGGTPAKADVIHAMQGHVLAKTTLIGTYQR
jgi:Raf kinase inhibitor-like YbhB/YbcL family protein